MRETLAKKADHLLRHKKHKDLTKLMEGRDPHIIAELINELSRGKRKTFSLLQPEVQAEVAVLLSLHTKEYLFSRLPDAILHRFLHFNREDDATDILQFLGEDHRKRIVAKLPDVKRRKIEKLLAFDAETAGGLMDLNFLVINEDTDTQKVIAQVQKNTAVHAPPPVVILQDSSKHVIGYIPHRNLLFKTVKRSIAELVFPVPQLSADTDREQILEIVSKRKSSIACVVDDQGKILGIIHLWDLLSIAHQEATEDVYLFAGVDTEESIHDTIFSKMRHRQMWLLLNLVTAFLAALVVGQFQESIAKLAILAVFMPMVAGEGGNAATQALAVTVRGLAGGHVPWEQARKVVFREGAAGLLNGLVVGIVAAGGAMMFGTTPLLGLVLGSAMVINLFVAGIFGSLTPFVLRRMGVDPAIASSIFVTTATDVFGFLAFLGLGTWILL